MLNTAQNTLPVPCSFNFDSKPIRTVSFEDGSIWFVAKDVAFVLGITWSGHTLDAIPSDWIRVVKLTTRKKTRGNGYIDQEVELTGINEPAVYKLAFRSNKPEADRFTNWVASEVLPTIRKTGCYVPEDEPKPTPIKPQHIPVARIDMNKNGQLRKYAGDVPGGVLHMIHAEALAEALGISYYALMAGLDPAKFQFIEDETDRDFALFCSDTPRYRPVAFLTSAGLRKLFNVSNG